MTDTKKSIDRELIKHNIYDWEPVNYTPDSDTLPDDLIFEDNTYYQINKRDLTDEEVDRCIQLKQIELLSGIKSILKFFKTLAIISIVATVIYVIAVLFNLM